MWLLITALRNASAVYAVFVCLSVRPSVRLSVTSRYCIETTRQSSWFWHEEFLSHIRHLSVSKNYAASLWNSVLNTGLRQGKLSTKLVAVVVVDGQAPVQQSVYFTSVNCNPLTPLLRFVVDFVVQLVSTFDKILTGIASRGPSAVVKLLVLLLWSSCVEQSSVGFSCCHLAITSSTIIRFSKFFH